jgi:predicted aspartyl protease
MVAGPVGRGGLAMMRRLILALMLAAGAAHAEDKPDCRLKTVASLELQTTQEGRVTVPVQVEGHDYRMLVDTGGYINTLSQDVVRREGYKPLASFGTTMKGIGNTKMDTYVTVKDFTLGHSRGTNFKFFVDDLNSLFYDGILAPEILATYDADFDFAHDKLNLFSPDHCPGKVIYWTRTPYAEIPMRMEGFTHISVPLTLDGKEIDAILDTGAAASMMSISTAARLLGIREDDPAFRLEGNFAVNGMMGPVWTYPFQTMSFGGVSAIKPRILIVSDKVFDNRSMMIVGIGILRQLHFYIAYHERKLYVTPATAN